MVHRFHLYFYCPNIVTELLPGDLEYIEAFLEDLANRELQSFRLRTILIVKAEVNFDPSQNQFIIHFRLWCLYNFKMSPHGLGNIAAEVEARLSLALLELFGGELPFFVESVDG